MPVTGNTEQTRPENRAFFPALDGLRAVAFVLVFYQHYYSLPWGWTGVNIFFVLSGFLITGILFDTREDAHRARNFYIRRTLRIFPLYYGIFVAILVLDPVLHWRWSMAWLAWPLYLANFLRYLSPSFAHTGSWLQLAANAWLTAPRFPHTQFYLGHFWSLCVEEQFYLVWPWIVFWVRDRRRLIWICGVTVVVVPLLRVLTQHFAAPWMLAADLLDRATPFQLDSLLLGGLLALLWRGTAAHRDLLLKLGRIVAVAAAIAAACYLAFTIHPSADPDWHVGYDYPGWIYTWGLSFINLFAASVILCCLRSTGWLFHVLSLKPLRWLGRISYGAYVFHDIFHGPYSHLTNFVVHQLPFLKPFINLVLMMIAFCSTMVIASLSFRFFESPFLNLKERWTRRERRTVRPS
jgi:peptidoglycan/LPS O-acetylase OafA/YrhL